MEKSEIEKIIEDKIVKGAMAAGLYDTGLSFVLVDIVGDGVTFRWFDYVEDIGNHI